MTLLMRDQENIDKGREQGLEEGRKEGLQEGLKQVIEQGGRAVLRNLCRNSFKISVIRIWKK